MRSPPPAGCDGDTSETMRTRSGSFTRASPERPEAVLVEVFAHPELRHHQRPEAVGMSLPARQMPPLHAFHRLLVEEPSRSNAAARQPVGQRAPPLATQPVSAPGHGTL